MAPDYIRYFLPYPIEYRDLLIAFPIREPSIFRGIAVSLLRPVIGSRYKTNYDFETAIPHYIDG